MDKIKNAFDSIHAEERLKKNTFVFLQGKIQRPQKNHRGNFRRLSVALACFMVLAFSGILSYSVYFDGAMHVDVDINPSVEFTVNRFGRIIGAHAYNADGEKLLAQRELMHKSYDRAIILLTETAIQSGFLSDGGLVSVTLQSADNTGEDIILKALQTNIASTAQEHHALVRVDAFSVDSDTWKYAHEQNLTPAKYLAILELQEVDPTATVEGCRHHTIGEIRGRIEAHSGRHHRNGHHGHRHR